MYLLTTSFLSNFPMRWLFAGLAAVMLFTWAFLGWKQWHQLQRKKEQDPLELLISSTLRRFGTPLLSMVFSALFLIGMGFSAGSSVSMILFVVISSLSISILGLIFWWLWPNKDKNSNLFDLLPIPSLEWPIYENQQDRELRDWVQKKSVSFKKDPPEFQGSLFGSLALEISEKAAQVYHKKNVLSVSVESLLKGLQRTAKDLKFVSNHLPFADKLTLADIERQIEFGTEHGKTLYITLYLIFSLINPGNLLRVLLFLLNQKSPWSHLSTELQGWVYANYTERLGYHMGLIYSDRKPPPLDSEFQQQLNKADPLSSEKLKQKLNLLSSLALLGLLLYLLLQVINSILVYGFTGAILSILCLLGLGLGLRLFRQASRWTALWADLMPQWPEQQPLETEKDELARLRMQKIIATHQQSPPEIESKEDLAKLSSYYGDLLLELWEACYISYRHIDDPKPQRATRELYLPQAFAGIEQLSGDLYDWHQGDLLTAKLLRQIESMGLGLEVLYARLQNKSEQPPSPEQVVVHVEISSSNTEVVVINEGSPSTQQSELLQEGKKLWKQAMQSIGKKVKSFAVEKVHNRLLELLKDQYSERLISIYGAHYYAPHFQFQEEQKNLNLHSLLLARGEVQLLSFFEQLVGEQSDEEKEEARNALRNGSFFSYEIPNNEGSSHHHLHCSLWQLDSESKDSPPLSLLLHKTPSLQKVLLIEQVDYGAKANIGRYMEQTLVPSLRDQQVGQFGLVLTGIEKLKPLRWEPPYDDYKQKQPQRRKAQRIKNAVEAWETAITEHLSFSQQHIFPVGKPKAEKEWGHQQVAIFLDIPKVKRQQSSDSSQKEVKPSKTKGKMDEK